MPAVEEPVVAAPQVLPLAIEPESAQSATSMLALLSECTTNMCVTAAESERIIAEVARRVT